MSWFQGVSTVLFDMDGTLYQDFAFHRDYLRYLLQDTEYAACAEDFIRAADEILTKGAAPMNRFYRMRPASEVRTGEALLEWINGCLVEEMPFARCYQEGLNGLHYLGDPWEVATFIAAVLGTLSQNGEKAFLRVREEMQSKTLVPNKPLLELLEQLKGRYTTVLLSNSPQESAAGFIDKLGFTGAFSYVLYDAHKPYRLFENLRRHPALADIRTEELLSVGDHAFNEIVNVHLAGGKTVWMNPYGEAPQVPCTCRVKSIPDLMSLLRHELLSI